MPDITNPTVIDFSNTFVRPMADRLIGQDATMATELSRWFATISPLIAGNVGTDPIADGAAEDGRTVITKADVENVMTQVTAINTQVNGPGVKDVLVKPSVNPGTFAF